MRGLMFLFVCRLVLCLCAVFVFACTPFDEVFCAPFDVVFMRGLMFLFVRRLVLCLCAVFVFACTPFDGVFLCSV